MGGNRCPLLCNMTIKSISKLVKCTSTSEMTCSHHTSMLPYIYASILPCSYTSMLPYFHAPIHLCSHTSMLPYIYASILLCSHNLCSHNLCSHTSMLLYIYASILPCSHTSMLPYFHAPILPCSHTAMHPYIYAPIHLCSHTCTRVLLSMYIPLLPSSECPSCLHTTLASLSSHPLLHMVVHSPPAQNSTLPSRSLAPPTSRTSPWLHTGFLAENKCTNINM